MKKILLFLAVQACISISAQAQVLDVKNTEQEKTLWCWAASSKAILDYYKVVRQQCDIAEWVRVTATLNKYGSVNCCENGSDSCNYWNWNYGEAGSIQDILVHFGNIQNEGLAYPLTKEQITSDIQKNRLFVIRWGWVNGNGGHFIVGHGIDGDNIYFMNPWPGEGLHIGTYGFMLSGVDGTSTFTHEWTHTNRITNNAGIHELTDNETISVHPNPFITSTTLHTNKILKDASLTVYSTFGQQVKRINNISGQTVALDRDRLPAGIYLIRLTQGATSFSGRLIIKDN